MKDSKQVAGLLNSLYSAEPVNWLTLLVINKIVPHPRKPDIKDFLRTLQDSIIEHDVDASAFVIRFLQNSTCR